MATNVVDFKIKGILMPFLKITTCAIISGIISVYLYQELSRIIVLQVNIISIILNLSISSVFFIGLYCLFCFLFKIEEVTYLFNIFISTIKAKTGSLFLKKVKI